MVDQAYYDTGCRWDYFRWNVKYGSWDTSLAVLKGVPKSRIGTYTTWDEAEWDVDLWDGTPISAFEFYITQGLHQVARQDPPKFEDAVALAEKFAPPSFDESYSNFENQTAPSFAAVVKHLENNIKSQTIEKALQVMENR